MHLETNKEITMKIKNIFAFLLLLVAGLQSVKAQVAYAVLNEGIMTFYYDTQKASRLGTSYSLEYTLTGGGEYYVNYHTQWEDDVLDVNYVVFDSSFSSYRPTRTQNWFAGMENLKSVIGLSFLDTSEVTDMSSMFQNCEALTSIDLSHFNTEKVEDMSSMFYECKALTNIDLSHFNTGNVTDMASMFSFCENLTSLDLSNFNTEKVTSMTFMFYQCEALASLDVSSLNTSNVHGMDYMFCGCEALTSLDVSHFDTGNVDNMEFMFYLCKGLTSLDVSHFNTSKVTNMNSMFNRCSGLTSLDITNFNTENVTAMGSMFYGCSNLTEIDVSNFDTKNVKITGGMFLGCGSLTCLDLSSFNTEHVTNMYMMFLGCTYLQRIYVGSGWNTEHLDSSDDLFRGCERLVGGAGTTYNPSYTGKSYAHIDEGPSNPGYLAIRPYDFMKNGICYNIIGSNAVEVTEQDVVFHDMYCGRVVIPATVDYKGTTYNVTNISESTFRNCTGLIEVSIPNSVTEIGDYALNGCTYLRTITCLAPTPPTVYSNTFSNYDVRLIVPSASKSLYQTAPYWKNFTNIQEKKNYDFEYGGIYYKDMGGNASAAVTYKDSDYGTYSGDVVIPEEVWNENDEWYYRVSQIGERAFYRCPSLKSVTIPATVDLIDSDAFLDSFVEFPTESSITCLAKRPPTVSPYAFGPGIADMTLYVRKGCKAAYEAHDVWKQFGNIVELPYHFQVRNAYYQITGENTVSVVNRDANYYSYWSQVTIPPTVTYEGVTYTVNKIANVAFFKCPELIRVIMPSTITSIGNRSFKDCTRLTSITIPENVQSIGLYAFDGCTGLNLGDIYCLATTPPSIDYTTFTESQYQGASLYVPYGCYGAYSQAPYWKNFCDIFELPIDPDAINEVTETVKETPWYDLSGRKVTNPRKGIYIKDGKKVLIK